MTLGNWFSISRKGGKGGGGLVYIYTQSMKQHGCLGLVVKSLNKIISPALSAMALGNSHLDMFRERHGSGVIK